MGFLNLGVSLCVYVCIVCVFMHICVHCVFVCMCVCMHCLCACVCALCVCVHCFCVHVCVHCVFLRVQRAIFLILLRTIESKHYMIATHRVNVFWVSKVTLVAAVAYYQDDATHDHQQHNPTHHNAYNFSSVCERMCGWGGRW